MCPQGGGVHPNIQLHIYFHKNYVKNSISSKCKNEIKCHTNIDLYLHQFLTTNNQFELFKVKFKPLLKTDNCLCLTSTKIKISSYLVATCSHARKTISQNCVKYNQHRKFLDCMTTMQITTFCGFSSENLKLVDSEIQGNCMLEIKPVVRRGWGGGCRVYEIF